MKNFDKKQAQYSAIVLAYSFLTSSIIIGNAQATNVFTNLFSSNRSSSPKNSSKKNKTDSKIHQSQQQ